MLLPQAGSGPSWPASAVHDTVAAIARDAAYRRSLRQTLLDRLLRWVGRVVGDLFDRFRGSVTGRDVTIALLVLLALLVIARIVIAARSAEETDAGAAGRARRVGRVDPWSDAERLAGAGQFTDAAHSLYAALLSAFAARGDIRLHASKTAGDYVRELARRGAPAHRGFDAFRRRYDRVIYGTGDCSADDYAALLRAAQPLLVQERAA